MYNRRFLPTHRIPTHRIDTLPLSFSWKRVESPANSIETFKTLKKKYADANSSYDLKDFRVEDMRLPNLF